jgi:cytoskeletal protein CcmA (bactofilin family)
MFGNKPSKPSNRIDSLIGTGTKIEGNVIFNGGLRIDGEVHGNVFATGETPSTLVVSEQARIDGEVAVSHMVVNGTINGPIRSTEFLELQPRARITGDVAYNSVEMHLGAIVDGRLVHQTSENDAMAVELKLAASH